MLRPEQSICAQTLFKLVITGSNIRMLRYSTTTISLTMEELHEFERHRRFMRYLAMEDARSQAKTVNKGSTAHEVAPSDALDAKSDPVLQKFNNIFSPSSSGILQALEDPQTPKLLSIRPRRPPEQNKPDAICSQEKPSASQSSLKYSKVQSHWSPAYLPLPTLPLPFSQGIRKVSHEHCLPSQLVQSQPQTPRGERIDDPTTRIRRPSQSDSTTSPTKSPVGSQSAVCLSLLINLSCQFSSSALSIMSSSSRTPEPRNLRPRDSASSTDTNGARAPIAEIPLMDSRPQLRVYNDALPTSTQPQTPQNVPEARHQSRLRGSYTAPPTRAERQSASLSNTTGGRRGVVRSPPGLTTPGFRGLYGGVENSDDTDLYREGRRLEGQVNSLGLGVEVEQE
ncbi:hypothetical protein BX600DRAFT_450580 [Xylariales sp. PMI_506]|nr:hypothetical protein BX600DRAFT_450580 [Xylariales sp. PMI_506]